MMTDAQRHFDDILRSRRTIGAFQAQTPPREQLLHAVKLACWAPNHRKTEPWRFTWLGPETVSQIVLLNTELVSGKKGLAEAEKKQRQWSAVPGWLLVNMLLADDPFQREEDYAACCCAIQNLMLALWNQGVGTKWSTGDVLRHPRFAEIAGFDPGVERAVGLIWYGYPAVTPTQTRKPLTELWRELP